MKIDWKLFFVFMALVVVGSIVSAIVGAIFDEGHWACGTLITLVILVSIGLYTAKE